VPFAGALLQSVQIQKLTAPKIIFCQFDKTSVQYILMFIANEQAF
jgi:membrane-anchored glycerophosphoryl diester phosphodiesterase (GDPDase)